MWNVTETLIGSFEVAGVDPVFRRSISLERWFVFDGTPVTDLL
jgi:hypothetical protein